MLLFLEKFSHHNNEMDLFYRSHLQKWSPTDKELGLEYNIMSKQSDDPMVSMGRHTVYCSFFQQLSFHWSVGEVTNQVLHLEIKTKTSQSVCLTSTRLPVKECTTLKLICSIPL